MRAVQWPQSFTRERTDIMKIRLLAALMAAAALAACCFDATPQSAGTAAAQQAPQEKVDAPNAEPEKTGEAGKKAD
jgi:hypothetical protein